MSRKRDYTIYHEPIRDWSLIRQNHRMRHLNRREWFTIAFCCLDAVAFAQLMIAYWDYTQLVKRQRIAAEAAYRRAHPEKFKPKPSKGGLFSGS